jgi:hypothetical protein
MTDLQLFTLIHEAISVIGVVAGFVVMYGFLRGDDVSHFWNRLFLVLTILTSVTGFFFPFRGVTQGIVLKTGTMMRLAIYDHEGCYLFGDSGSPFFCPLSEA